MAILSAILTMIGRKLGQILRAVLGWATTGLFGKVEPKRELALTGALVLALVWPLLVVGIFVPAAASWAVAFLPLQRWVRPWVLRVVWCALALTAPILVGGLARFAAPPERKAQSAVRGILAGYPLTLGFFVAFVLTAVVVPALKLVAALKRWVDEHVFIQVRAGHYRDVLQALCDACRRAGVDVKLQPMPRAMALPTLVVNRFSRGVLSPLVADEPMMLKGPHVELYLYPADLLIRGDAHAAMRIRAAMTRTLMRAPAHLTQDAAAQKLEDEIDRLWGVVERHRAQGFTVGAMAAQRVRELRDALDDATIPFADWTTLYADLHRLERAVEDGPTLVDPEPLPGGERALTHGRVVDPRPGASVADLVRDALRDAEALARAELDHARAEARQEIARVRTVGVAAGVALGVAVVALVLLLVAAGLAVRVSWVPALVLGVVLVVAAAGVAAVAYRARPKNPLALTRERIATDVNLVKEQLA